MCITGSQTSLRSRSALPCNYVTPRSISLQAELSVDDFLPPDDPRIMAEGATFQVDRLIGCVLTLWQISPTDSISVLSSGILTLGSTLLAYTLTGSSPGKVLLCLSCLNIVKFMTMPADYEQALEFDQLRQVMAHSNWFAGFNEAAIRFPPTFKYDVYKRSRHLSFKRPSPKPLTSGLRHDKLLSEVAEQEHEGTTMPEDHASQHGEVDDEMEYDGEAASVVSSAWTSVRSRHTDFDQDDELDSSPPSAGGFGQSPPASASTSNLLVHKMWSAAAAHKAKQKWVALWTASGSPTSQRHGHAQSGEGQRQKKRGKWRQSWASAKSPPPSRRESENTTEEVPTPSPTTAVDPADPRQTRAGRNKEFQAALLDAANARPHKHLALSENNVDLEEEEEKGVYDSSHKQRVPSW